MKNRIEIIFSKFLNSRSDYGLLVAQFARRSPLIAPTAPPTAGMFTSSSTLFVTYEPVTLSCRFSGSEACNRSPVHDFQKNEIFRVVQLPTFFIINFLR
ncbi:unnamed protein product, partial [Nesidiocoris tenuis]